jgi:hypothetical protein
MRETVEDPLLAWARDLHICQEKYRGPHHTFRRNWNV